MPNRVRRTFDEISHSAEEFARSDALLLSPDLTRPYAGCWVAAYQGKIVVASDDLTTLTSQLMTNKIPMATVAIRFIEKDGIAA